MALGYVDDNCFKDIANAIRNKSGSVSNYYPGDMANAINNISGSATLGTKTITSNGLYNAEDDSLDGYNSVTVAVPIPTFNKDDIQVTQNGTYNAADSGLDGFNSVEVAVPLPSFSVTNLDVSENGVYNAESAGYDGFSEVNVQVPTSGADLSNFVTALDSNGNVIGMDDFVVRVQNRNFNKSVNIGNNITNCAYMFEYCNINASVTIPDSVLNTYSMFEGCNNFNQPVHIPNTANDVGRMFYNCPKFNQALNIPKVNYLAVMVGYCINFNSAVTFNENITGSLYGFFRECINFNQPVNIPNYANNYYEMFSNCRNFNSAINWNCKTYNSNAYNMFANCNNFNQPIDISDNLNNCAFMFANCYNFNQNVHIPNKAGCANMFYNCRNLNQPIDFSRASIIYAMFSNCINFNQTYNTVIESQSMEWLFNNCSSVGGDFYLESQYSITTGMFANLNDYSAQKNVYCYNIGSINNTGTSSLVGKAITWTAIDNGFYNSQYNVYIYNNYMGIFDDYSLYNKFCNNTTFDAMNQEFRTGTHVTNMSKTFDGCTNFNVPVYINNNVTNCASMLNNCVNFNSPVYMGNNIVNARSMFRNCVNFNQPITIPEKVVNCDVMFQNTAFNQPLVIPNNVKNCKWLLFDAADFNQPITIGNNVVDCVQMLEIYNSQKTGLFNQPLYLPASVADASYMLYGQKNMKSDIVIMNNSTNLSVFLGDADYEGNIYINSQNGAAKNMFYNKTNATGRINIFVNEPYSDYRGAVFGNYFTGLADTWISDDSNNCVYSPTANIYYICGDWHAAHPI